MPSYALILSLLAGLAAADGITLQLFDGPSCNQDSLHPDGVVANVASNPGADKDGSGCVAHEFNSSRAIDISPGFQCNLYSDASCQNFLYAVTAQDGCDGGPGGGVICFNQALFENPFAESSAQITVGNKVLTSNSYVSNTVSDGIGNACGNNGCDPTNKASAAFIHFNQEGTQTVSVSGNYDNGDQRDYMKGLLLDVLEKTKTNMQVDTRGSAETDDITVDVFSFYQVVINDKNGNNQAQMSITLDVTTNPAKEGDCGIVGTIEGAALGEVPAVGGLLAKAFELTCEKAG
ncbi:hypothetical protein EJ04DRAFT_519650 [Polyplosphaeria fusca]|uniref:Uncharacterized protein n=1 Tax=Polyplosphaeria fusca TaxID=682080 RepID=A0A9P4V7B2_9PLEO|nr:hypothetical protein EJ04DRAFT_519650 [Polyplosphaeria fusca]